MMKPLPTNHASAAASQLAATMHSTATEMLHQCVQNSCNATTCLSKVLKLAVEGTIDGTLRAPSHRAYAAVPSMQKKTAV
jgi:hypothetical protein